MEKSRTKKFVFGGSAVVLLGFGLYRYKQNSRYAKNKKIFMEVLKRYEVALVKKFIQAREANKFIKENNYGTGNGMQGGQKGDQVANKLFAKQMTLTAKK